MVYYCDPEKNVECRKNECFINGGECYRTHNKEFERTDLKMTRVLCTAVLCKKNSNGMCFAGEIKLENVEYRTEAKPEGSDYNDKDDQICKSLVRKDKHD